MAASVSSRPKIDSATKFKFLNVVPALIPGRIDGIDGDLVAA